MPVQPSTCSWETLNDIHHWLRKCEQSHAKCRERRQIGRWRLPIRLLFVGAFEPKGHIYLREGIESLPNLKYATLSHCWGRVKHPLRLETISYPRFRSGIPIEDLPQTFKDAVGLTRALGIDFLWIDSLCIIQDSPGDWSKECTRMSDIYSGSFINIAANSGTDSHGSLYHERNPLAVTPFRAKMSFTPNRWNNRTFVFFPHGDGLGDLYHAPLSKRAWVAQERLLSPRTIHFLKHKVKWECASLTASETDAEGKVEYQSGNPIYNWAVLSQQHHLDFHRDAACLVKWNDAVQLYTRGSLSCDSDKLIAISGVARFMKETLWRNEAVRYYVGLWSYNFEWQLLWGANEEGSHATKSRAPSWSWASYNGQVSSRYFYHKYRHDFLTKVTDIQIDPVDDLYGAARSGYIKVRGPMCRVRAVRPRESDVDSSEGSKQMQLVSSGSPINFEELVYDEPSLIYGNPSIDLALLGVVKSPHVSDMQGLVLQPTPSKVGEYRRVGSFTIRNWTPQNLQEQDYALWARTFGGDDRYQTDSSYLDLEQDFASMCLPKNFYNEELPVSGVYGVTII